MKIVDEDGAVIDVPVGFILLLAGVIVLSFWLGGYFDGLGEAHNPCGIT